MQAKELKNAKYVFIIGIGGSDLASKAVWQAMTLNRLTPNKKLFFIEAPDSRELYEIKSLVTDTIVDLGEVALVVISKSGQTTETLDAFNQILSIFSQKFGEAFNGRVLVISTPETPLWQIAEERNLAKLPWEGEVGGRFSAFTIAHTSVLSLAGLDVDSFARGGATIFKSEARELAQNLLQNYEKGLEILDFFIFNNELEDLGKWCRQLFAESLSMMTPTVSLGPVDLHSMLELYLGGPKNRYTIFVRSLHEIEGGVAAEAYQNVTAAYTEHGLPFFKYEMPEINEFEIGKFMALMMQTVVAIGEILGVNVFDQPAVEAYKAAIRKNNNQ